MHHIGFLSKLLCSLAAKGGYLYYISDNNSFWIIRCLGFESPLKGCVNIVAALPQPATTKVLLKRQGWWCSHNEILWIQPGSYSMQNDREIRTGHFTVLQIY